MNEEWLFRPGDIVYQWGPHWAGYGYIRSIDHVGPGEFPVYRVQVAKYEVWDQHAWKWTGSGMLFGVAREQLERICTYVCPGNPYYFSPNAQKPIKPWWKTEPGAFLTDWQSGLPVDGLS